MAMPGRNIVGGYRYGYQGQFSEKDDETGHNFFERRLYDARIMRWLRPDDVRRTSQSPYMAMGNNPILHGDPDGRDIIILNATMA
ncbi:MAG: RHS repeat-associated core domain-containing protein, partial [Bacteroidota bacterium]